MMCNAEPNISCLESQPHWITCKIFEVFVMCLISGLKEDFYGELYNIRPPPVLSQLVGRM